VPVQLTQEKREERVAVSSRAGRDVGGRPEKGKTSLSLQKERGGAQTLRGEVTSYLKNHQKKGITTEGRGVLPPFPSPRTGGEEASVLA